MIFLNLCLSFPYGGSACLESGCSNGVEVCGGERVFVRIWFFLRQVARYLPFAIYKEYCGCRVRK